MSIARTYLTNDIAFSWAINPLVISFPFLPESDAKQSRVSTMTNRAELFLAAARRLTVAILEHPLSLPPPLSAFGLKILSISLATDGWRNRSCGEFATATATATVATEYRNNREVRAIFSEAFARERNDSACDLARFAHPEPRGYYPAIGATKIYVVSIDEEASLFFLSLSLSFSLPLPPSLPHGSTVPVLSLSFCTRSCQLYLAGHRVISH